MEYDSMVLSDGDTTTYTALEGKKPVTRRHKCTFSWLYMGLGIAFLTVIVAITIVTAVPKFRGSIITAATKKGDNQKIALKAIFSTTYAPDSDNQPLKIKNLNDVTNQLNKKLNENKIQIIDAIFRDSSALNEYRQIICENSLTGYTLQLNIIAFSSSQCTSQNKNTCIIQFLEELKKIFNQMSVIPINIQFNDNQFVSIDIKLCSVTEMLEEENTDPLSLKKSKLTMDPIRMVAPSVQNNPIESDVPYPVLKKSNCNLDIGKIILVQLTGEGGTRIQDDVRINAVSNDDQYRQYLTVTLYEDTTYRLNVQFDCNGQRRRLNSKQNNCNPSQTVNVWIDYNDNEYDDQESRVLNRIRANRNTPRNTYDLDLYIPVIDERNTRRGLHRMRITVTATEEYQRDCGAIDNKETREYTVNIVPKATYSAPVQVPDYQYVAPPPQVPDYQYVAPPVYVPDYQYVAPPVQVPAANIVYRNPICSQNTGKISLVIMAGERGTEIRDDNPPAIDSSLYNYENRHHLAVTIYEHTVYLLRVQLDCSWQLNNELFDHGCNLAQDVSVWIDLNNDGRYDESELGTPYRWPVTSYLPQGNYDLQLYIPLLDDRYTRIGKHQMRVVVTSSDYYRTTCGRIDYNETRDYTVNIIPRTGYIDTNEEISISNVLLNNIVCSPHVGKIILVIMAGEHRTQIRDDLSRLTNQGVLSIDNQNQLHQAIVLYEGTVYLSRIQLDCSKQWNNDLTNYNCHLIYDVNVFIDLNDDGIFDSTESAVPYRWPINSYTPKGIYDLQIYVPIIDGRRVKTGPHRMQLVVTMSEHYHRKCGENQYKETREYTVSIVPNTRQLTDPKIPFLKLNDNVCSLPNGKLSLVIMAGEQGTEIRDNILTNKILPDNQNRHHLSVSLHENTYYRLRVTLDCHPNPSGGLPDHLTCNLAQDVNVFIDLNNDQRFDESESRISQRWPLRNTIPLGIYDFEIEIPVIDRQYINQNSHKMKIVVTPSDEYNRKCGKKDFSDTREYTINIIPKTSYRELEYRYPVEPIVYPVEPIVYPTEPRVYPTEPRVYPVADTRLTYCSIGNLICSEGSNGISLVNLIGEQNTEIRDELKICNPENNYNDRNNLIVTLFDNTEYSLRIELYCVQGQNYDNYYNQDSTRSICSHPQYVGVWIDFNNDGTLDENQGEMISNNWYEDGQRTNVHDLRIIVPQIDRRYYVQQQHRMRIILTQDQRNLKACYSTGYGEARDYTIQILPKPSY